MFNKISILRSQHTSIYCVYRYASINKHNKGFSEGDMTRISVHIMYTNPAYVIPRSKNHPMYTIDYFTQFYADI